MKQFYRITVVPLSLFMLASVVISSCTSGKAALERGNYYESVMSSTDRLRRNPDHKKSVATLRAAYPLAVQYYETEIGNLEARDDRRKWSGILNAYTRINNMYESIRTSPGALTVVPNPKNYYDQLATARQNAAEENYQYGLVELAKGTRQDAKNAYQAFTEANGYVNNYKDVIQKMDEALWMATLKVLVAPIPVTNARVQLSANFFEDKIHEELQTQPINEFVRFMSESELNTLGLSPDHILELSFDEFTIGELTVVERQIDATRDSVKVGSATFTGNLMNTGGRTDGINTNTGNTNTNTNTGSTSTTNTNTGNTDTGNTSTNTGNTNTGDTNTGNTNTGDVNTGNTNTGDTGNTNTTNTDTGNNNTGDTNTGNTDTGNANTGNTNTGNTDTGNNSSGKMITVCDNGKSVNVAESALASYLDKGATVYECGTSASKKVKICHKTNGGNTVVLSIPGSAVKAHLAHGDSMGGCDGSSYDTGSSKGNSGNNNGSDNSKGKGKGGNESPLLIDMSNAVASIQPTFMADTVIDVYSTVKARVFIYEKTLRSTGTLDFKIFDAYTNSLVSAEKLSGEHVWMSQWGYFNGDERALNDDQRSIVSQKEMPPPSEQEMFRGFTGPIFQQLIFKLRDFYKNY